MADSEQSEFARTKWRSRRGLLELDLFLLPFVERCYSHLASEEKRIYQKLLQENDMDILAWLSGAERPDDNGMAQLVDKITRYAKSVGD